VTWNFLLYNFDTVPPLFDLAAHAQHARHLMSFATHAWHPTAILVTAGQTMTGHVIGQGGCSIDSDRP